MISTPQLGSPGEAPTTEARDMVTYSWWTVTASFTFLVVHSMDTVGSGTILSHALPKNVEKKRAFKTHFSNAAHQANFTKAESVVTLLDLVHTPFEFNAFFFVCFFN